MPTEKTTNGITLKHPAGSTVVILFYGATIVSWKVSDLTGPPKERLFVSSKAFLDGSKPVRGGIPVVFPCFGPPTHPDHSKLPQHGFARNQVWKLESIIMDNEAGVSVRFSELAARFNDLSNSEIVNKFLSSPALDPNEEISSIYPKQFHLAYVVTLAAHQLSTDIHVQNTSSSSDLEFQALLHSYIRAPADQVTISPLQGLSYFDKTESTEEARAKPKVETRAQVDVINYTDSVYENAPNKYQINWPQGGLDVKAHGFKDVVVWNPQDEGRKIGDMEPEGWKQYVCVEPGYVRGFVNLGPQKIWLGQQVLSLPQK